MLAKIPREAWLWYIVALAVMIVDQISKVYASAQLSYGEPIQITSFFNFTLLHNHGAAFSFLSEAGGWQRWFFAIIAIVVSSVLIVWIARSSKQDKRECFALAFILGGAIGNLYDRVVLGHVVDFIVIHYQDNYWPAFNIADSAITLGAFILIAEMFLMKEKKSNA
ncbi:MAG: lipoprotein signal peptidase [Moraxellaceae bacterium]|nr:MAG: lipoprotein signal peptidase [Moraxellaceae bacterium]